MLIACIFLSVLLENVTLLDAPAVIKRNNTFNVSITVVAVEDAAIVLVVDLVCEDVELLVNVRGFATCVRRAAVVVE